MSEQTLAFLILNMFVSASALAPVEITRSLDVRSDSSDAGDPVIEVIEAAYRDSDRDSVVAAQNESDSSSSQGVLQADHASPLVPIFSHTLTEELTAVPMGKPTAIPTAKPTNGPIARTIPSREGPTYMSTKTSVDDASIKFKHWATDSLLQMSLSSLLHSDGDSDGDSGSGSSSSGGSSIGVVVGVLAAAVAVAGVAWLSIVFINKYKRLDRRERRAKSRAAKTERLMDDPPEDKRVEVRGDGPAITGKLRAANDTVKATLLFKDVTPPEPPPEEPKAPVQPAQTPISRQRSAPKWDPVDDLVIGSKLRHENRGDGKLTAIDVNDFRGKPYTITFRTCTCSGTPIITMAGQMCGCQRHSYTKKQLKDKFEILPVGSEPVESRGRGATIDDTAPPEDRYEEGTAQLSAEQIARNEKQLMLSKIRSDDPKRDGPTLALMVMEARGLLAKDDPTPEHPQGTSDPFVTVTYGKESRKTYVILKTLTPEWNQTFRFELPIKIPNLELAVWDDDSNEEGGAEEGAFLGKVDIKEKFLKKLRTSDSEGHDQWYKLEKRSFRSHVAGELRVRLWWEE